MDEETFEKKLQELIHEIARLPGNKQKELAPPIEKTKNRHDEIKKRTCKVTNSLLDLRICLKYILFDLEATRRERDRLKKVLDKKRRSDDEPNTAEGDL